jgi:hypothetical protein
VIEVIAHGVSTMRMASGRQLVLGLALEFRLADEDRQHAQAESITSSAVIDARFLRLWSVRHGPSEALVSACAALFVRAAFGVGMVLQ